MSTPQNAIPQGLVQFIRVADFLFRLDTMIALDLSYYKEGAEGRNISLVLVGPYEYVFENERADAAWFWYLQMTGQNRIDPATITPPK
jgi:hypothetical protein